MKQKTIAALAFLFAGGMAACYIIALGDSQTDTDATPLSDGIALERVRSTKQRGLSEHLRSARTTRVIATLNATSLSPRLSARLTVICSPRFARWHWRKTTASRLPCRSPTAPTFIFTTPLTTDISSAAPALKKAYESTTDARCLEFCEPRRLCGYENRFGALIRLLMSVRRSCFRTH